MPTLKPLSDYPPEYGQSFLQACREPVTIECEDEREAINLRALLYAYRTALWEEPYVLPAVSLIASLVKLRVSGNKLILERHNTMEDKIGEALRRSARPQVPQVPRQLDDHDGEVVPAEVLS